MKLVLVLMLIGLFAGCSQKPDPSTPTSTAPQSARDSADSTSTPTSKPAADSLGAPSAQPSSASGQTAPVVPQPADAKEIAVALDELTQVLRKYSFEHRRVPKTFSEVVAAGYLKNMPQAPPGKKFEIDPKTVQVVLVKQ